MTREKKTAKKTPQIQKTKTYGTRNRHSRMHGGPRGRQTAVPLRHHPQQKKPTHPEPARKEKIQPKSQEAHPAPRDQIITQHAAKNRKTPIQLPPCQSHDAAPSHGPRFRGHRLQKPRTPSSFCHGKRKNPASSCDWHVGPRPPQNHPRDQKSPRHFVDEIIRIAPRGDPHGRADQPGHPPRQAAMPRELLSVHPIRNSASAGGACLSGPGLLPIRDSFHCQFRIGIAPSRQVRERASP